MKNYLLTLFLVVILQSVYAQQNMFSLGYSSARLGGNFESKFEGLNFNFSRDIKLSNSDFKLINHLDVALLYTESEPDYNLMSGIFIGISPKLAYAPKLFNRLRIAPFVGPFISWAFASELFSKDESKFYNNGIRAGLDTGIAFDFTLREDMLLRFVPIRLQYGNDSFSHTMVQLGISIRY